MPKIKTKKSIAKRFKVTKKKKVMKRGCNQDHFNARETGQQKRAKKLDRCMSSADAKNIRRLINA
jgi:large subunit ribosomal protein L35